MKHDKAKNKKTNEVILAREVENEAIDCDSDVKKYVGRFRTPAPTAKNGKTLCNA